MIYRWNIIFRAETNELIGRRAGKKEDTPTHSPRGLVENRVPYPLLVAPASCLPILAAPATETNFQIFKNNSRSYYLNFSSLRTFKLDNCMSLKNVKY